MKLNTQKDQSSSEAMQLLGSDEFSVCITIKAPEGKKNDYKEQTDCFFCNKADHI